MVLLTDLDKKDRAILSELDKNCRQSNAEIARKLRLGKHTVSYRIAQLEKRGAIKEYSTVIDMSCLGWQSYRVYLKLYPMEAKDHEKLMAHLVDSQSTWWVGEMDGEWNVGFVVWVPDHYEFEKFWKHFSEKFQQFIEKNRITIYLRLHSYSQAFLRGNTGQREEYVTGVGERRKIDEKDMNILKVIAARANLGTVEIAKATGLTAIQVTHRIKKLVKTGVIKGFRANIHLDDLALYKADFQLKDVRKKKEMLSFASNEKWCIYVDETIGFADFELDILCLSYPEFKDVVERFKAKFFAEISGYQFEMYSRVVKIKYF